MFVVHSSWFRIRTNWQNPNAEFSFVHNYQCPSNQISLMLAKGTHNNWPEIGGKDILSSHLKNARSGGMSQRQQRSKIQVVSEHHILVCDGPRHDLCVGCSRIPDH